MKSELNRDCKYGFDKKIKEEVTEIAEFAKNSPEPDESELMTDIYTSF